MQKLNEFKKLLKKKKITISVFFGNDSNIRYFTGFNGFACLIIPVKKIPVLLVPELEYTRAKTTSKVKPTKWKKNIYEYMKRLTNSSSIGINKEKISYNQHKKIKGNLKKNKIEDVSKMVTKVREIKTEGEIEKLKIACKKTDEIIKKAIERIKENKIRTETGVASFLVSETIKQGMDVAFDPIVASGENSRHPHHKPQKKRLGKGFCVIDYGVKYKNYCADMTRTIYLGSPSKQERDAYSLVLDTQRKIIKEIKKDKSCKELHLLSEKLLKQKMIHALGHGIGIEVHESPSIHSESKDRIKKGMVIAIEPGIYKKQGIRIEDTILIKDKPIILTKMPKTLIVIKNHKVYI